MSEILRTTKSVLPENVLAFRTITTLLAGVQQEKPAIFDDLNYKNVNPQEVKELRISTAFANLSNTRVDVIAIATSISVEKLEVVVSAHNDNDKSIDHPAPSSKITDFLKFIFSSNSRTDDPDGHNTTSEIPYINEMWVPPGVDPEDVNTLQNYIENEWCVDCHNLHSVFTSYSTAISISFRQIYTNTYGH